MEIPEQHRADLFKGPAWEQAVVDDSELPDDQTAEQAIATLREVQEGPFFLAVGFLKPHLPFVAPKKYWELHDPATLHVASNTEPPERAPECALHTSTELRKYADIPSDGPVSDDQARALVHGYYASVSYMDAQVGKVLTELDRLQLRENTIVVLWGDHGWHLGEHGLWCKHSNYETGVRIPLIVSIPETNSASQTASGIVELVDLYPTLVELCKLPAVPQLEGVSFSPLLSDPSQEWKQAAFSQYPREVPGHRQPTMGRAIRTPYYRLVEWTIPDSDFRELELYDQRQDPDENYNLASLSSHQPILERMQEKLVLGWQAALPADSVAEQRDSR